jgi:hypothetical protein
MPQNIPVVFIFTLIADGNIVDTKKLKWLIK